MCHKPTMNLTRTQTPGILPRSVARPTSLDSVWAHGGSAPDLPRPSTLFAITLPPLREPSEIASGLPQLPHPRELLPSYFNMGAVLSVRNHESGNFPPEATLPNLTGYVTKDDDYPAARGGFGEIWKCTYLNDRRPIKVAVKALQVYTTDQTGEAKKKKNNVSDCDSTKDYVYYLPQRSHFVEDKT
ncbi:hypothetical protein EV702DRAFT_1058653 [Suillus placidus]|uniref:Protein kinase domain-containing protein n=1 Tax=Suillus placidus TaxID=48579 RepID=A0A9P7A5R3_9AGAM|nr:hypothetical protein EV702DRAFT_1058653 [Suillus placidus]